MEVIEASLARLKLVVKSINKIVREEVIKEQKFIEKLNRDQLKRGTKASGEDLPDYVEDSDQPSAPGKITLFETGEFYEGIKPLFDETGFENVGLDEKTGFLVAKYGDILGLTTENIALLSARVLPRIQNRIRAALKVG